MKILVGCEFSGVIRDAFRAKGHDAYSCDLLSTKSSLEYHIQDDIRNHLTSDYDLLIAHPPCTYLCMSGERWFTTIPKYALNPNTKYGLERFKAMEDAVEFFKTLWNAPIQRICLENPKVHTMGLIKIGVKPNQKIQPFNFGHLESKGTYLWLKNLPLLVPTSDLRRITKSLPEKERNKSHWMKNDSNNTRAGARSITYQGIAEAMASQWSSL